MSEVARAYHRLTLRQVTPRVSEWLEELVEHFGEEAVVEALEAEADKGEHSKLLGRARERLVRSRPADKPRFIGRDELLAIARGEQVLVGTVYWDWADLTPDEETEVLEWRTRVMGARR